MKKYSNSTKNIGIILLVCAVAFIILAILIDNSGYALKAEEFQINPLEVIYTVIFAIFAFFTYLLFVKRIVIDQSGISYTNIFTKRFYLKWSDIKSAGYIAPTNEILQKLAPAYIYFSNEETDNTRASVKSSKAGYICILKQDRIIEEIGNYIDIKTIEKE